MSDLPKQNEECYLGDGLYVSFDGFGIKLRAPRDSGDHFVVLEPDIYHNMLRWVARYPVLWEHFATKDRA